MKKRPALVKAAPPDGITVEVPTDWLAKVVQPSYSADRIIEGKPRKQFTWDGSRWVSLGGMDRRYQHVYRVPSRRNFPGKTSTYHEKGQDDHFQSARNDRNGFYDAVRVNGNEVLSGPEVRLVPQKQRRCPPRRRPWP
jgi:hypothetical protein